MNTKPAIDEDFWSNIEEFSQDASRNPLLACWYSLDDAIAALIVPALKRLRENQNGHPVSTEMYEYAGMTPPEDWLTRNDDLSDVWAEVIEKIHDAFVVHMALDDEQVAGCFRVPDQKIDYRDREQYERLLATRNEGLGLFAKFFGNLWD